MTPVKAKVEMNAALGVPRRYYDIDEPTREGDARTTAEEFLKKVADELRISPDLSELKFDQVRESILGQHVLFQQQHDDRPISGAWVRVDINRDGEVYNVQSDLLPAGVMLKAKAEAAAAPPQVAEADAVAIALQAAGDTPAHPLRAAQVEQVSYPLDGSPRPSWKVIALGSRPPVEKKVYVDAASGAVLAVVDLVKSARGRVFDPHPVASLNDLKLKPTSSIPDSAYVEVELRDLAGGGTLDGPYVTTAETPNRAQQVNGDFRFNHTDAGFKEVMVYYHIDAVQRYIQRLGFTNVLNAPIKVNVFGYDTDNSSYNAITKTLAFGRGDVCDAEDAEIILHEYGHAIQDSQVPGFGIGKEAAAMGEGFGDYLAASFFADHKAARMQPCVGAWDAIAGAARPPCLRRVDSKKKYPADMTGRCHGDGEIWSACLWKLREALGRPLADRLILAHHFLLSPSATFADAANALLTVDQQLNGGRNAAAIRAVFARRGILPATKKPQ